MWCKSGPEEVNSSEVDGNCVALRQGATMSRSASKRHIIVGFAHEASSIKGAISSAIEAVRSTGASITRIEPDLLVSLSEIAARSEIPFKP